MSIACAWKTASAEFRDAFPDATQFHDEHADNLAECDAWRCECGNEPHLDGFEATDESPEDLWTRFRCRRCGRVYDAAGGEVQA